MANKNYTGKVVAKQGNGIHISKGSANGGPTLAELCKQLGGEAGTSLANSAPPPSIPAPSSSRLSSVLVGLLLVALVAIILAVVFL